MKDGHAYDTGVDIYGLGCLLYELSTLRRVSKITTISGY